MQHEDEALHVAMLPWLAFGHINPYIHLSNKLSSHGITISFFSTSGNIPRIKQTLNSSPNTQIIPLHIPSIEGLPAGLESTYNMTDASMPELLKLAVDQMELQIKTLLADLKPHVVLFDFAHHWLPPLAYQLGIKTVHFSAFSAIAWSYYPPPSRINEVMKVTTKLEMPTIEELKRPPIGHPNPSLTLKAFEAQNLTYRYKSFYGGPPAILRSYLAVRGCDAIALKSCYELEGPYIEYIKTHFGKPVLLPGLLLPEPPSDHLLEPTFATWLARFPPRSVVVCSFGSETFLGADQVKELALGLELAGLPFILILNLPEGSDPADAGLPSVFVERVHGKGMVHTGWVQQQQILAHESVGCCVSHAGFGSLVEALVGGCQLVLLPLKGDQFFNSKLFGLDLKVGVEVNRRDEDGWFGKCDVSEAVEIVMVKADEEPGKSIRDNQRRWREFLMKKEIQEKYVCDLVKDLKALAWKHD